MICPPTRGSYLYMKYLKSGFFIITSSLLSISLVTALTTKSHKDIEVVKGNTYSISFDKDNNKLFDYTGSSTRSGDASCKTLINNDVHIGYLNAKYSSGNWISLPKNGEIFNTSSILGMTKISITTPSDSSDLVIYYGNTVRDDLYSRSITTTGNVTYNFDFNSYAPNYFLIKNNSSVSKDIAINMMDITFSCSDSHINEHGQTLSISGDKAIYGMYPRRKVISSYLSTEIDTYGESLSSGYTLYKDQYYYKDGSTYFTSNPIHWRVLESVGNTYTLLSEDVIDNHIFDDDSNVYDDSELKIWLNDAFIAKGFALDSASLTGDVTILEKDEINDSFKLSNRTEYSEFKGVYSPSGNMNTRYWTKTIYNTTVWYMNYTGAAGYDKALTATDVGVRPIITVSL